MNEALLAVAHGSRDPRHAAAVEALVARVRSQRPGLRVEAAYLDHCGPTAARALHEAVVAGREQGRWMVPDAPADRRLQVGADADEGTWGL